MRTAGCILAAAASSIVSAALADVVKTADYGFEVRNQLAINAPAMEVYRGLGQIGRWWNPEHTYSGRSANLSLALKAGGCFCEKLPGGGGVQHMTVVLAIPGKRLRLSGALGPLQSEGAAGSLDWEIVGKDGETVVVQDYVVGGYSRKGWQTWSAPVDEVLHGQLQRLKNFVETGKP